VTTEILLEYQEIISKRYGLSSTDATLGFLVLLPNVSLVTPFFKYPIIETDPTDNKFIECALMGVANLLVSNDRHFQVLKQIQFPPVNIVTYEEFKVIWLEKQPN
jgi:predicted nucleic acid-binding protein